MIYPYYLFGPFSGEKGHASPRVPSYSFRNSLTMKRGRCLDSR